MFIHVALTSGEFPVNTVDRVESHCFWALMLCGWEVLPKFLYASCVVTWLVCTYISSCMLWVSSTKTSEKNRKRVMAICLVEWSLLDKPHLAFSFLEEVRKGENLPSLSWVWSLQLWTHSLMGHFPFLTTDLVIDYFIDFYIRLNIDLLFIVEVVTAPEHYVIF